MSKIPKIIHQLWIGPKSPPTKFMDTWKNKHEKEGFEYIRWTEEEMKKRGFESKLMHKVNEMEEINGKADILRWELLYEYGGFFVDADAYCMEPVTYLVENYKAFAGYENEKVRGPGWGGNNTSYDDVLANTHHLIATGTMAFPPKHELPKLAIEWIKNNEISVQKTGKRAWRTVGPGLLTRLYYQQEWKDITILPSFYFLPIHVSGVAYFGRNKIYANQEWGSTKQNYANMNNIGLPDHLKPPTDKVSILVSSYNTKAAHIKDCLESIFSQQGHIFFEVVWVNDGSNEINTKILKKLLNQFENHTSFVKVIYHENDGNKGIGTSLNTGIKLCSNEIIIKLDSDDIMLPDRITKQLEFMKKNPDIAICGGQILMFNDGNKNQIIRTTYHPTITWNTYKQNISFWFINHPTVCYRKSKVLEAGNYSTDLKKTWGNDDLSQDFELELRMLKKYGKIYNFPEPLVLYRLHPGQVTHQMGAKSGVDWDKCRNHIINTLVN